jgi:hypothetical protein
MAFTRYTPQGIDDLRTLLDALSEEMKIEADEDTGVMEKTVGKLRARTAWPGGLVVTIPRENYADAVVKISKKEDDRRRLHLPWFRRATYP